MGPRAGLRKSPPSAQIGALPLDLGLSAMIACQDAFKAAVLSAIPRVTDNAGVTKRRCTTTCPAMLIGAENEHRSSPTERDVRARWSGYWGWSSTREGSDSAWGYYFGFGKRYSHRMGYSYGSRALCVRRPGE